MFDKWAQHVLKWEGGFVNDPADSGGITNKGVTWSVFRQLAQPVLGITPTPSAHRNLTDDQVKKIMAWYWQRSGADQIQHPAIAAYVAEVAWGSGFSIAGKSLQRVLNTYGANLAVDGAIGPKTLQAVNSIQSPGKFFQDLISYRAAWLKDLVARRPKDQRFIQGWMNRLTDFAQLFASAKIPALAMGGLAIVLYLIARQL